MNDFGSWLQDNWYELGTLLTLMGFLLASVWFARNFLKTMRTFQRHIGALLQLSLSGSTDRPQKSPTAKDALAEGISSWLEKPAIKLSAHEADGPSRFALVCSHISQWLLVPIHAASAVSLRMVRWLQAPIRG